MERLVNNLFASSAESFQQQFNFTVVQEIEQILLYQREHFSPMRLYRHPEKRARCDMRAFEWPFGYSESEFMAGSEFSVCQRARRLFTAARVLITEYPDLNPALSERLYALPQHYQLRYVKAHFRHITARRTERAARPSAGPPDPIQRPRCRPASV